MTKKVSISGFSAVKNGIMLGYPVVEAIKSVLPVVDEFVITIGKSEDDTLEAVKGIRDPKIKIIETVWDPRFTVKGRILAVQSDIALFECKGDWAFYIQADEVLPEDDQGKILSLCECFKDDEDVEGFLFDYMHFFGNYNWYLNCHPWYPKEIRVIRNHRGITSWRSAQSFRLDGKRLAVIDSGCRIFHYGWVRPPEVMVEKRRQHERLHHGEGYFEEYHKKGHNYLFEFNPKVNPKNIKPFLGKHPEVMIKKIESYKVNFNPAMLPYRMTLKGIEVGIIDRIGRLTGWYPERHMNYRRIKK